MQQPRPQAQRFSRRPCTTLYITVFASQPDGLASGITALLTQLDFVFRRKARLNLAHRARCQPHSTSAPPAPRFLGTNSKWITPPERRHRLRAAGWVASHFIGAAPAIALGPAADILCVHTLCTMLPRTCHQAEQCTLVCHHWSESRRQRAGSGAPITKKPWLCWWWNRRWRGVEAAGSCACALLNAAAADVR